MSYNDNEVISKFIEQGPQKNPVIDRTVLWVNDSNSGSYNGQLMFNLQSIGSSGRWLSYQEAYLVVPYVISVKNSGGYADALINKSSITIKDGFHSIIDNLQITVTGKTICQTQNFVNAHASFKLLNTMGYNSLTNNSSTWGLFADTPTIASGVGTTKTGANSVIAPTGYYVNRGNIALRNNELVAQGYGIPSEFDEPLKTIKDAAGSFYSTTGTGANKVDTWVYMCTIRLGSLVDFFEKVPLTKTTDIQMNITYNSSQIVLSTVETVAGTSVRSYNGITSSQLSGSSCPFIFSVEAPNVTGTITIESGILKAGLSTDLGLGLTTCRIYVPSYVTNASTSLKMIQLHPTTDVRYNDAYMFLIRNIAGNANKVETLSTGISGAKYLVCLPFNIDGYVAGVSAGKETYLSPFNTAPSSSSFVPLDNFQVMVAGKNMFDSTIRYDFNAYIDNLSKLFSYAGDNDPQISSGIISKYLYENLYRAYVCDLSRREESEDTPAKSIVVSFKNTCANPITVMCFVAYERSVKIDTTTGLVIA
jgi:hypothetical protein